MDPQKEPFSLQKEHPVFLYKEHFFQVSPLWITPGINDDSNYWQAPIGVTLLIGWLTMGLICAQSRKLPARKPGAQQYITGE